MKEVDSTKAKKLDAKVPKGVSHTPRREDVYMSANHLTLPASHRTDEDEGGVRRQRPILYVRGAC